MHRLDLRRLFLVAALACRLCWCATEMRGLTPQQPTTAGSSTSVKIPAIAVRAKNTAVGTKKASGLGAPLGLLRTTHQAHSLTDEQARLAYPARVRGVVTYYDPFRRVYGMLFMHDASGGIFVNVPKHPLLPVHKGSWIEVTGVSDPGEYAPIIRATSVRVLGEAKIPAHAARVTIQQLMTGDYDSQWVEVEGVVHAVIATGRNTTMKLATRDGMITATTVNASGVDYNWLLGARVRLRADVAPQFNELRQMTGAHLYFQGLENFSVEQPGLGDPFLPPPRPIARLFRFGNNPALLDSVHLRGRLTLLRPGRSLCLQDSSAGLCVQTAQTTSLPVGSLIDLVGFPLVVNSMPSLTESTYRVVPGSSVAPVRPVSISAAQALEGNHAGELVQMQGRLIGVNRGPGDAALVIESGGRVFTAVVPGKDSHPLSDDELTGWREGSLLQVTGICAMQVDVEGSEGAEAAERFSSFSILLRSPDDAPVLRGPPWWNAQHTMFVLLGVLAVGFALAAWAITRRRYHFEQNQAIRESEERYRHLAQHDALTGLPNRMLLHDRLTMELERARRHGTGLALLMMDLDGFKHINDTLGHHIGDQLLCCVAQRLSAALRRSDTVARMGGDEFVILLADLEQSESADEVAAMAVHLIQTPMCLEGHVVTVSVSVGLSTYPEGGNSVTTMLQSADAAMYRAKSLGRNRFERFSRSMRIAAKIGSAS